MRIHPNYLGMFTHHIEACHKGRFIQKIIILKNKGERVVSIMQRDVNLSLERRAIAMTSCINNIKVHTDGIGRLTILPQASIGKAVYHKGNADILFPVHRSEFRRRREKRAAADTNYVISRTDASIFKVTSRIEVHHKISSTKNNMEAS